jgi:hypothetical protein
MRLGRKVFLREGKAGHKDVSSLGWVLTAAGSSTPPGSPSEGGSVRVVGREGARWTAVTTRQADPPSSLGGADDRPPISGNPF